MSNIKINSTINASAGTSRSLDRISCVLANTVQFKDWDSRIDNKNFSKK